VLAVSDAELKLYKEKKGATVVDSRVVDPFDANRSWSVEALRGPDGLRRWSNDDVVPRPGDVFQERLYCIRWVNVIQGKPPLCRPRCGRLAREAKVLELLRERFADWQREGFIPSKAIPRVATKPSADSRARLDALAPFVYAEAVVDAWGIGASSVVKNAIKGSCGLSLGLGAWQTGIRGFVSGMSSKKPGGNWRLWEYKFSKQALEHAFNYSARPSVLQVGATGEVHC
jgi:putative DNA methylase